MVSILTRKNRISGEHFFPVLLCIVHRWRGRGEEWWDGGVSDSWWIPGSHQTHPKKENIPMDWLLNQWWPQCCESIDTVQLEKSHSACQSLAVSKIKNKKFQAHHDCSSSEHVKLYSLSHWHLIKGILSRDLKQNVQQHTVSALSKKALLHNVSSQDNFCNSCWIVVLCTVFL